MVERIEREPLRAAARVTAPAAAARSAEDPGSFATR
jgi:hypothetical protein